jgi:hypothetical protein
MRRYNNQTPSIYQLQKTAFWIKPRKKKQQQHPLLPLTHHGEHAPCLRFVIDRDLNEREGEQAEFISVTLISMLRFEEGVCLDV